jgi:arylsulfatase A-like enzyme
MRTRQAGGFGLGLSLLSAGAALATLPACAQTAAPVADSATKAAPAAQKRPNIVFIMADDLGWGEVGCYGQKKIRTPNIDRLAAQGTLFTRAYSGAPVCAPSRCVLMTGLDLSHAPIRGNLERGEEGQIPLPASCTTWSDVLRKDAGYTVCGIGKWGLGMPDNEGSPLRHGFFHFYGYMCQRMAHGYYPPYLWSDDKKVALDNGPHGIPGHGSIKQPTAAGFAKFQGKDYAPDRMMVEAKAWLDQRAKDGKPFTLYLPFTEPHLALQPPQRIVETYPKEWDPKPYLGQNGYTPHPRPHAAYAAMITSLDEHVGQVMQWLEEHKMADNTIIIFTSDNGATHDTGGVDTKFFNSVGGLRGRKGSLHEGGMRVPFIVRWPGHTPVNAKCDETIAFPDMLPTICDLAGVPAPTCDGVSVRPLFEGKPLAAAHPPVVFDYPEYGGQQAVIDGRWKLIRKELTKAGPGNPTPWELYDLVADRNETTDLAAKNPGEVKRLEAVFHAHFTPNADFPMYPPEKAKK